MPYCIGMIKVKNNVPYIYFRQAHIDMTMQDGSQLGTYTTLSYQDDAPTKEQWLESVFRNNELGKSVSN